MLQGRIPKNSRSNFESLAINRICNLNRSNNLDPIITHDYISIPLTTNNSEQENQVSRTSYGETMTVIDLFPKAIASNNVRTTLTSQRRMQRSSEPKVIEDDDLLRFGNALKEGDRLRATVDMQKIQLERQRFESDKLERQLDRELQQKEFEVLRKN